MTLTEKLVSGHSRLVSCFYFSTVVDGENIFGLMGSLIAAVPQVASGPCCQSGIQLLYRISFRINTVCLILIPIINLQSINQVF